MTDALLHHAQQSIKVGSKSFDAAARLLPADVRRGAMMLYAWCRHCDDTIDNQTAGWANTAQAQSDGRARLDALREQTQRAYAGHPMTHPAFAAFQDVITRFDIPMQFAFDHLAGYEMDVQSHQYETLEDTLLYCYRVAGVVGLMMASVLGVRSVDALDRACDLGLAFQLTNIARDIIDDAAIGRVYVPTAWLHEQGLGPDTFHLPENRERLSYVAAQLVETAEPYYASASAGLQAMPIRSAWAIATALGVYREIGIKVIERGATAWDARVRTGRATKVGILAKSGARAMHSRIANHPARHPSLWVRPGR